MADPSLPIPVQPMTLAEARRLITDADYADGIDAETRRQAWRLSHAHRRNRHLTVTVIVLPHNQPPGDAA